MLTVMGWAKKGPDCLSQLMLRRSLRSYKSFLCESTNFLATGKVYLQDGLRSWFRDVSAQCPPVVFRPPSDCVSF